MENIIHQRISGTAMTYKLATDKLYNDWTPNAIGDLFEIKQGKSVSSNKQTGNTKRPFLRTSNIFWGKLDLSTLDYMNFTDSECNVLKLKHGDLLVCEGGDVGRTAIWRNECSDVLYQNHLHRLRAKNKNINSLFFMYWMQASILQFNQLEGLANRTTIPNLSRSRLSNINIFLPPLPEQEKIAAVLFKIQKAIETQEKILTNLKELKKATMEHLFTYGTKGEKTKQTEIGEIPESWEVSTVAKHCYKPEYGYTEKATSENIGPHFLRITDVTENGVNWNTTPYCKCPSQLLSKYKLKDKDLLFARIGATTGKSYIINNPPTAIFASYLIRLRAKETLNPLFLFYFFQTNSYWKQIDANKGNNLKGGINGSILALLLIVYTKDKNEQLKISSILNTIDNKINLKIFMIEKFKNIFNTTLNQLITGQTRVNDIDINTSEVLNQ